MVLINKTIQFIQDQMRVEDKNTESRRKMQKDNEYLYLRENASLAVLEEISKDHKNDSQALNFIERKKMALKLEVPNYLHIPIYMMENSVGIPIMISMHAFTAMNFFGDISRSTNSQKTRDRIEKELAYIHSSLHFEFRNSSVLEEMITIPNKTDALQYTERMLTKLNLTEQEQSLLDEIKEFKITYREKLEKQITMNRNETKLSLKPITLPNSSVELNMHEYLLHDVSINVLEELLKKHWNDLAEYVIINEKLQKLKDQKFQVSPAHSSRINLLHEGLNIYINKQETTEIGRNTIKKLTDEDIILIDELRIFKDDYKNTVESEINEYMKKFTPESYAGRTVGIYLEGYGRYIISMSDTEEVAQFCTNTTIEDKTNLQISKFEKLQMDVKDWNYVYFRDYENQLRGQDKEAINEILYYVKKDAFSSIEVLRKNTSSLLKAEQRKLSRENPNADNPYRGVLSKYIESRYKVDPFIFMRRLERIEKELKQLMKLSDDAKLNKTIEKTLGTIENIDHNESSLQIKEQFDTKYSERISVDRKTQMLNALRQKSIDNNFTTREQLIFKKIGNLVQEYKQKLQEKLGNSVEGSGFDPASDLSNRMW